MATSTRGSGSYLPEELIFRILSWTCVTSLLRCRSVCKSWLSIISQPEFHKAHHTNSLNKLPSILIITSKIPLSLFQIRFDDDDDDDDDEAEPEEQEEAEEQDNDHHAAALIYSNTPEQFIRVPLIAPFNDMEFVSSCNSILCVCNALCDDIYLLNPLTKMFKRLPVPIDPPPPPPPPHELGHRHPFRVEVVFGFHCVSRDYKVLRIVYTRNDHKFVNVLSVDLYSVNADCWRTIEFGNVLSGLVHNPYCATLRSGPVADGVLYLEAMNAIVTFDLDKEMFGMVSFPGFMHTKKSNVFDFQGSVAVLLESFRDGPVDDREISLWTMEAVSGEVFWNKIFTFDSGFQIDWVFLYLGAKQFVGKTKLGTVLYDYSNKQTKCIGLPSQRFPVTVLKHRESFLSVEGFKEVGES